jgi:hypothetical protein
VQGDFRPGYQNISIILHGPEIASAFLDEAPLIVLNNQVQINADDWSRLKVTIH